MYQSYIQNLQSPLGGSSDVNIIKSYKAPVFGKILLCAFDILLTYSQSQEENAGILLHLMMALQGNTTDYVVYLICD